MTEGELFEKCINQELELLASKENYKALLNDAKDSGLDKKDIALVKASAKIHVDNAFEEKTAAARELEEKYRVLTGYDE